MLGVALILLPFFLVLCYIGYGIGQLVKAMNDKGDAIWSELESIQRDIRFWRSTL